MAFSAVHSEADDAKILGGDSGEETPKAPPRPRRGRPPKAAASKPKAAPTSVPLAELRKMVEAWHVKAGMFLAMTPIPKAQALGMAIIEDAEKGSAYIVKQAQQSPKFRRALENMARGSNAFEFLDAYGHVIFFAITLANPGAAAALAPYASQIFGVTQSDETDVPAATQSDDAADNTVPLFPYADTVEGSVVAS